MGRVAELGSLGDFHVQQMTPKAKSSFLPSMIAMTAIPVFFGFFSHFSGMPIGVRFAICGIATFAYALIAANIRPVFRALQDWAFPNNSSAAGEFDMVFPAVFWPIVLVPYCGFLLLVGLIRAISPDD